MNEKQIVMKCETLSVFLHYMCYPDMIIYAGWVYSMYTRVSDVWLFYTAGAGAVVMDGLKKGITILARYKGIYELLKKLLPFGGFNQCGIN